MVKTLYIQNKEKILKVASRNPQVTYKGKSIRVAPNVSMEEKVLEKKKSLK